jgi:hypothetical protein
VCFSIPAQAKLGETVPQLIKRFGKSYTIESDAIGMRYRFRSEKLSVDVLVANDASIAETYFSDHPLTGSGEPPNDIVRAMPQPEDSVWTMTVGRAKVVGSVSTVTPPSPVTTPLATQTPTLKTLEPLTPAEIARRAFPSVVLLSMQDARGQPISLGSGFFVGNDVVATNFHVIDQAAALRESHWAIGEVEHQRNRGSGRAP